MSLRPRSRHSGGMLSIALELAEHDGLYREMVLKFAEHFAFIAAAMDRVGDNHDELWDEEDGFFYDVLRLPDGTAQRLKVRSMRRRAGRGLPSRWRPADARDCGSGRG